MDVPSMHQSSSGSASCAITRLRSLRSIIAEGVGEFAANERRRFLRISRRSALEAASQLLVIRRQCHGDPQTLNQALALLHRIVCMLTKMASSSKDRRTE
jgi:four helix bundle protein